MNHFDADYEGSEDDSPSHRLGVTTPTPQTCTDRDSRHDNGPDAESQALTDKRRVTGEVRVRNGEGVTSGPRRCKVEQREPTSNGAEWKLGTPYYRNDGTGSRIQGPEEGGRPGVHGEQTATTCADGPESTILGPGEG